MVESTPIAQVSQYQAVFERKVTEVFEFLEIDPKKALRLIEKEIETRGQKILLSEQLMLKIVRKEGIFGVLDEILKNNMADHYVLDTLVRTASRMGHKNEYMQRYLEVIEVLQT